MVSITLVGEAILSLLAGTFETSSSPPRERVPSLEDGAAQPCTDGISEIPFVLPNTSAITPKTDVISLNQMYKILKVLADRKKTASKTTMKA